MLALSWVVEEAYAPLARLHPGIDEVIPVATRRWRASPCAAATWREIGRFRDACGRGPTTPSSIPRGSLRTALIARRARNAARL